jgi:hypothetical protein
VAKKEMICPFSSKSCINCSVYRGRHYFLCFNPQYRGHLTTVKNGRNINERLFGSIFPSDFVIPKLKNTKDHQIQ